MNFIFPVILILLFSFLIYKLKWFGKENFKKYFFVGLFALKLLGGIGVFAVYTFYYDYNESDIRKYFKGGEAIYKAAEESAGDYLSLLTGINSDRPELFKYKDAANIWTRRHSYGLYNDDRTIIRFHALLYPVSQGNIYVHLAVMAFLSFLGCVALYKALSRLLPELNRYLLIFSCFLIPSCLFWTSGLLKEGLMMFASGFTILYFVKLYYKFNIQNITGLIIFSWLLVISKIYVLPALLPAFLFFFITRKMRLKGQLITLASIFIVAVIFVVFSKQLIGYDIIKTIAGKQNDFLNFLELTEDKGSSFELKRLEPDAKSFFTLIPRGLLNSFFKPFISDINSSMTFISFLEIVMICFLAILSIISFKKPDLNTLRFVFGAAIFILFLYTVIGLYTPNIGALVRYRTPALPFLATLFFCLTDWKKILKKIDKKNKLQLKSEV